jgi:hypothetical protein
VPSVLTVWLQGVVQVCELQSSLPSSNLSANWYLQDTEDKNVTGMAMKVKRM